MKLSLATRIFLGYAAVLVTFGAVSLFSVAEMHQNQVEIRLVSEGYLPLAQHAAAIATLHGNQEKDTERLTELKSVETRRAFIKMSRYYFPETMTATVLEAQQRAEQTLEFAPPSEVPFVSEVALKLGELKKRYAQYQREADAVFDRLEAEAPDWTQVSRQMDRLKQTERSIGSSIKLLHLSLTKRILERVALAEQRERRTGVAIIGLSVLAIVVGVLATLVSARMLKPVRTLIEGVSRISRGDYSAQLGIKGDDEISVLAREFDQMARSLKEREEQLKEKQEALLRAEQLAAVGRVSAQVAHEVRNPLSSIGLNVELLDELVARARFDSESDAKEARALVTSVTRELDRLTEVSEEYLKMARLKQPALTTEDVSEVLVNVLDFSREELERSGVAVERDLAEGARALADEGQLRQVFLNLLRNSKEAMPQGGTLTVTSAVKNGSVEVTFADTGVGIPSDVRARLFEPFFSTKDGGTGLGLAVSKQILQAHGGSIECESGPGGGTRFVVKLVRA